MTLERIAEAQADASGSTMTLEPTHPNMKARQCRQSRLKESGSTGMNLETRGSTAKTLNLGIGKQRQYHPLPAS